MSECEREKIAVCVKIKMVKEVGGGRYRDMERI